MSCEKYDEMGLLGDVCPYEGECDLKDVPLEYAFEELCPLGETIQKLEREKTTDQDLVQDNCLSILECRAQLPGGIKNPRYAILSEQLKVLSRQVEGAARIPQQAQARVGRPRVYERHREYE